LALRDFFETSIKRLGKLDLGPGHNACSTSPAE
jgi:hypothetical protein